MPRVTGLVLTKDGDRLLGRCLESLSWCDELLVVDSESTDRTQDIAREHGARLFVRPWPGPVEQFRFALGEVQTEWVVSLDQDELLTDELTAGVRAGLESAPADLAGFWVKRRSFYFNRFMKHSGWYPDRLLRVFRAGRMQVTASGAHYHFEPQGPTRRIEADIVHYPYRNFEEHLAKINSYAQQAADEMKAQGRRGGLIQAVAHAKLRFFKLYILKLGMLDGRAGLINALAGAYYAFQKYIRVEEKGDWGPEDRR
ncbi:MAG: glycosyltransferase family 2 protein [Desulfovibrionaceae bacterium]